MAPARDYSLARVALAKKSFPSQGGLIANCVQVHVGEKGKNGAHAFAAVVHLHVCSGWGRCCGAGTQLLGVYTCIYIYVHRMMVLYIYVHHVYRMMVLYVYLYMDYSKNDSARDVELFCPPRQCLRLPWMTKQFNISC